MTYTCLHIAVPEGVTRIKKEYFDQYRCDRFRGRISVSLPESIEEIEEETFRFIHCLEKIDLPSGLTEIADEMFYNCDSLKSITIPAGVKRIGVRAFTGCRRLKEVIIPDSVTAIDWHAFAFCSELRQIHIPDSVTFIGGYAFDNCKKLENFVLPPGITEIHGETFFACESLKSFEIHSNVTRIGYLAFARCKGLERINIPDSVTVIDERAFSRCVSLSLITVPDTVKKVGNAIFEDCTGLKELYFFADSGNEFSSCSDLFFCPQTYERLYSKRESHYPNSGIERIFIPGVRLDTYFDKRIVFYHEYFLTCPELFCEEEREYYREHISRYRESLMKSIFDGQLISCLRGMLAEKLIPFEEVDGYIETANKKRLTEMQVMLMEYKNSFPPQEQRFEL